MNKSYVFKLYIFIFYVFLGIIFNCQAMEQPKPIVMSQIPNVSVFGYCAAAVLNTFNSIIDPNKFKEETVRKQLDEELAKFNSGISAIISKLNRTVDNKALSSDYMKEAIDPLVKIKNIISVRSKKREKSKRVEGFQLLIDVLNTSNNLKIFNADLANVCKKLINNALKKQEITLEDSFVIHDDSSVANLKVITTNSEDLIKIIFSQMIENACIIVASQNAYSDEWVIAMDFIIKEIENSKPLQEKFGTIDINADVLRQFLLNNDKAKTICAQLMQYNNHLKLSVENLQNEDKKEQIKSQQAQLTKSQSIESGSKVVNNEGSKQNNNDAELPKLENLEDQGGDVINKNDTDDGDIKVTCSACECEMPGKVNFCGECGQKQNTVEKTETTTVIENSNAQQSEPANLNSSSGNQQPKGLATDLLEDDTESQSTGSGSNDTDNSDIAVIDNILLMIGTIDNDINDIIKDLNGDVLSNFEEVIGKIVKTTQDIETMGLDESNVTVKKINSAVGVFILKMHATLQTTKITEEFYNILNVLNELIIKSEKALIQKCFKNIKFTTCELLGFIVTFKRLKNSPFLMFLFPSSQDDTGSYDKLVKINPSFDLESSQQNKLKQEPVNLFGTPNQQGGNGANNNPPTTPIAGGKIEQETKDQPVTPSTKQSQPTTNIQLPTNQSNNKETDNKEKPKGASPWSPLSKGIIVFTALGATAALIIKLFFPWMPLKFPFSLTLPTWFSSWPLFKSIFPWL